MYTDLRHWFCRDLSGSAWTYIDEQRNHHVRAVEINFALTQKRDLHGEGKRKRVRLVIYTLD